MLHRCCDHDGVDAGISDERSRVGRGANARISTLCRRQPFRPAIADHLDACRCEIREVPDEIRTPVSVADDANADHARRSPPVARSNTRAGTPATVAPGATSRVTTAPAP